MKQTANIPGSFTTGFVTVGFQTASSPTNISKSLSHLVEVCLDNEILFLVDVKMAICCDAGLTTVIQSGI